MLKCSFMTIFLLFALLANGHTAQFIAHGNGVVTDQVSALMWQQQDDGVQRDWRAALHYCNDLVWPSGGYSDWRLPDKKELASIVDYAAYNPAINAVFIGAKSSEYWSSTPSSGGYSAWYVNFSGGSVDDWGGKAALFYVRCVR